MGVQMPAPMGGGFEAGFNPVGDMGGSYPQGVDPEGVQMPGDPSHEPYNIGQDMSGMASSDPIPVANHMGSQGGNGNDDGSISGNSGLRIITSFNQIYPGYTGTTSLGSEGEQNSDRTG